MPYQTEMAQSTRDGLSKGDFVFPKERKWPIQDVEQAKVALIWSKWPQHKKIKAAVQKAVFKKYPQLKKSKNEEAQERLGAIMGMLQETAKEPEDTELSVGHKDYQQHIKALRDWAEALSMDKKYKGQLLGTIGECEAKMDGIMAQITKKD